MTIGCLRSVCWLPLSRIQMILSYVLDGKSGLEEPT